LEENLLLKPLIVPLIAPPRAARKAMITIPIKKLIIKVNKVHFLSQIKILYKTKHKEAMK